jgi:hypothetical protein
MLSDKVHYNDEMLAGIFNRNITTIRLALSTFEKFGMIEIIDNAYYIANWEKHQNTESLDKIREQTRIRVQKHRNKIECNVTDRYKVTLRNATEEEREEEEDKDKDKDISNSRFASPTLELVKKYCFERQNKVDAERFIDFYSSKGWMIGKNKMKDWKAAVRNWEKSDTTKSQIKKNSFTDYDQREFDHAAIEKKALQMRLNKDKENKNGI